MLSGGEFPELTVAELRKQLDVSITRDTQLLKISATNEDPDQAARIANAVATTFVAQQNLLSVTLRLCSPDPRVRFLGGI